MSDDHRRRPAPPRAFRGPPTGIPDREWQREIMLADLADDGVATPASAEGAAIGEEEGLPVPGMPPGGARTEGAGGPV